MIAGCVAGALACVHFLPSAAGGPAASLNGLLPPHPSAVAAEREARRLFGAPLVTPYVVVQRDARGLPVRAQEDAYRIAVRSKRHANPGLGPFALAVPIVNTLGLFPGSREHSTTAVTYVFFHGSTSSDEGYKYARRYASLFGPRDRLVGVSGAIPARIEEYEVIQGNVHLVEIATVALILVILGISFRAVAAPLVTIVTAGLAFLASQRLLGWVGERAGLSVPRELTPVSVALMLGIVTDYSVFFLSGTRRRLADGRSRAEAVKATAASYAPIVFTAGLLVACGVATLVVGTLGFFRSFGPGMAITVATGLVTALLFVPASLALLGRLAFWPGLSRGTVTVGLGRDRLARLATAKPVALLLVAACAAGLVAAATGLFHTGLGFGLVRSLPGSNPVARAGAAAAKGFAPGILAPTEVIVRSPGIASRRRALVRLQRELRSRPGVAAALGPGLQPTPRRLGVFLAPGGGAARYAVVLDSEPTQAAAIATLRSLESRMPDLLAAAGLGGARVSYGGETALAAETVATTKTSLWRIAGTVLGVNLLFLAVFLRCLVAPLYLLLASAAALAATFGLTTYFFQDLLGQDGITYYLPIAVGVLLVSLGSDYNLFVVGRIWQEAERRPLREAVRFAAPRAGRAISVAGLAMALSFGLLALVPLGPFRVFAFAMGVGILLDALVVRTVLVPSLIVLFGRLGFWPRRPPVPTAPAAEAEPEPAQAYT